MTERTRRLPRWAFGLAVAVLVLAGTLFLVVRLVDVERYRPRIEAALSEATGWEVDLGELRLSVMHGLDLTVSPVALVEPGGDSRLDIGLIAVDAELWPLLHGELVVRRVDLDRPFLQLVRAREAEPWHLPLPAGAAAPSGASGGPRVQIEELRVRGGRLTVEDRTASPPSQLAIDDLAVVVLPETGRIWGTAHAASGLGRFKWNGTLADGFRVDIEAARSDLVAGWIGPGLVHEGGMLTGSVRIARDLSAQGALDLEDVRLLAGEQPVERAHVEFDARPDEAGWRLASATIASDGATLSASGRLTPALAIDVELPPTPVDRAVQLARSLFPLPVDLEPPGEASAQIRLAPDEQGALAYTATGAIAAQRAAVPGPLPPIESLETKFELDEAGRLTLDLARGAIAGGTLGGEAALAPVYPPGTLRFDGKVRRADLGRLLAPMLPSFGGKISGPIDLSGRVAVDLARETLDARALGGSLRASASRVAAPGWDLEAAVRSAVERRLDEVAQKIGFLDLLKKKERTPPPSPSLKRIVDRLGAAVDLGRMPWRLAPFEITVGRLTANGRGRFDPRDGGVDLDLSAALSPEASAEIVAERRSLERLLDAKGRIVVPVRVTGRATRPKITVDVSRIVDDAFEQALREEFEREAEENTARGLIERLLRRKHKPPPETPPGGGGQ